MEDTLERWCVTFLGSAPTSELFRTGHLSQVVGVALADGREVVIKIRAGSPRLAASVRVQSHLHALGYPCPEVLAGPEPFGELMATAEAHVPAHGTPPAPPPPEPTAQLLAELVASAPPASDFWALNEVPPWVGWDHPGERLWPWPDDLDIDMNRSPDPAWIDDTARRIRARLAAETAPAVIGHIDWEAHNLDWDGATPVVVHDWDSLAIRSEAAIAGAAATVYPCNGTTTVAATIEQTAAFLEAYERARPSQWSRRANETAWCAGLWVLTFNAKKESLGGGTGYLEHLGREHAERCSLAGI